jgi:hypothetical protein
MNIDDSLQRVLRRRVRIRLDGAVDSLRAVHAESVVDEELERLGTIVDLRDRRAALRAKLLSLFAPQRARQLQLGT